MIAKKGNLIVGQSGGPTAVINSSLAGVFQTAKEAGIPNIYGMRYGIEGLIRGEYIDLSDHIKSDLDVKLLKRTPSSYLGSCRYKLPEIAKDEALYQKIFDILKKLNIEIFLYIGGNDSMDTIKKLSEYAKAISYDIKFVGVPKTIDNDLPVTDHTPGFGSAAKCIGTIFKEIITDAHVYGNNIVTIVEIMGRNSGWLTAASCLSRMEDCPGPDLIFVPEVTFDIDDFLEKTERLQKKKKSVVIAVSEGLKTSDSKYVCELSQKLEYKDSFGHKQLSGTAKCLENRVAQSLGCKVRSIEFATIQRCASHIASLTDITEAFQVGRYAVKVALEGVTESMIVFDRVSNDPYEISFRPCPVGEIANLEKKLPIDWLTEDKNYVKEVFLTYCRPLIQGEVTPVMIDGLPRHLYHK